MRVLVTGGTGYLGSAIVRALRHSGHDPVVFARRASSLATDVETINGDIRDAAVVRAAVRGVDAVCHVAALVTVWRARSADFDDVNILGVRYLLDACAAARVPRIVYTSSFLALPPAGRTSALQANDYQRTKTLALQVVRRAVNDGAPIVTIVPGVVYGPGPATEGNLVGGLIRDHLAGRLPGVIGANRTWSYAQVDDVAAAHVAALTRGVIGEEYIAGGINAPQIEVFEIVRRLTGRTLPRRLPYAAATLAALAYETRARLTGAPPLLTRGAVEIFRHDWPLDSTATERALGYRRTALEDGIAAMLKA